jgi:hypothetical protein
MSGEHPALETRRKGDAETPPPISLSPLFLSCFRSPHVSLRNVEWVRL